jgi:hypothetical protein
VDFIVVGQGVDQARGGVLPAAEYDNCFVGHGYASCIEVLRAKGEMILEIGLELGAESRGARESASGLIHFRAFFCCPLSGSRWLLEESYTLLILKDVIRPQRVS